MAKELMPPGAFRRLIVSVAAAGLLMVASSSSLAFFPHLNNENGQNDRNLRSSAPRFLQSQTTKEYFILLHLSLEYVDDNLASEFEDPTSSAVNHLCGAVNEQAGGNQVANVAQTIGISIDTIISGNFDKPEFGCSVVYAGPVGLDTDDNMAASGRYVLNVTVEQVVYVTANRTFSLGEITTMVQSGFNRGTGGRVRFRSLLQDDPDFATVEDVEVVEGTLTRFPTLSPTISPIETPTAAPSSAPTAVPTAVPRTPVPTTAITEEPTMLVLSTPTLTPTVITARPSLVLTAPPVTNDENAPVLSATSPNNGEDFDDPLVITGIVLGSTLLLIALCSICILRRRCHRREDPQKEHLNATPKVADGRNRKRRPSKSNIPGQLVPDMVQLDDDNRSLANTTLGEQTAGGRARWQPQPAKKKRLDDSDDRQVRTPDSFDDNSLYTSHLVAPSVSDPAAGVFKFKGWEDSNDQSNSSVSNSVMLPPSVMPFEEESLMFPVDDHISTVSSTTAESGAVQSSLLSESFASSSVVASDTNRGGPVDVDAAMFTVDQENNDDDDPFGIDLFAEHQGSRRGLAKKSKVNDAQKAKLASQALEKEVKPSSAFSPFAGSGGSSLLKLRFDADQHPHGHGHGHGGSTASFRSVEDDAVPSAASSTSSLTKKVENFLQFGFQSPPEVRTHRDSSSSASSDEEEKREIDYEMKDDDRLDDDGLREGARNPLSLDLLADHQLLERSESPSSWSSWKITSKKDPLAQPRGTAKSSSVFDEESKTLSGDEFDGSTHKTPQGSQLLASGVAASLTAGLQQFLPIREGESKETSVASGGGESKEDTASMQRRDILTPASSGLSSRPEDGMGILGVQPRTEADALVADDKSVSSSSTGLSNPWLFDAVEQALGKRSATADIESLSGRSNRSGKSNRSNNSYKSHRSHKSNRSYNVPPSSKYKGRGEGRIRSAAASIASYKSSHTPLAPRTFEHDMNRLERQLAALHHTETDQVTASSTTLSSIGAKTRSTFSSKLTHTGATMVKRRRVIVEVPPGKLGVVLANRHDGRGTVVSEVRQGSSLKGMLSPGDRLVAIDAEDVTNLNVSEITRLMAERHDQERLLTVITTIHQESNSKSVTTL